MLKGKVLITKSLTFTVFTLFFKNILPNAVYRGGDEVKVSGAMANLLARLPGPRGSETPLIP
jgi:hypothetical protein